MNASRLDSPQNIGIAFYGKDFRSDAHLRFALDHLMAMERDQGWLYDSFSVNIDERWGEAPRSALSAFSAYRRQDSTAWSEMVRCTKNDLLAGIRAVRYEDRKTTRGDKTTHVLWVTRSSLFRPYAEYYFEEPYSALLHSPENLLPLLMSHLSLVTKNAFDVAYGAVFKMPRLKVPSGFADGLLSGRETKREKADAVRWASGVVDFERELRGVYFGNLLGPKHLNRLPVRSLAIARLKDLAGNNSVVELPQDHLLLIADAQASSDRGDLEVQLQEWGLL